MTEASISDKSVPAPAEGVSDPLHLAYVFTVHVQIGVPQEQGVIDGRRMRFVPITGGHVTGPRLSGTVLPGGGDWQAIHADGMTELDARYSIRADDGTVIAIVNPGVRTSSAAVSARIAAGDSVDPSSYYFRTTPRFMVSGAVHGWLRRTIFVGRATRNPDLVKIDIYTVS